ncbi:hypothetical protein HOY80DRAFT_544145 [Tuber brumale]|nr:hypothetical protein HOY80DRAFT_544145 [Tuber brumale]
MTFKSFFFSALRAVTCAPILIMDIIKAAKSALGPASRSSRALEPTIRGSRALIPLSLAISALCVLAAENKIDELAKQTCIVAFGSACSAIGSAIGVLGGPVGMIVGAAIGGAAGGLLGEFGYSMFKKWLFAKGEDGVRPIDRIADKLKAATDMLRVMMEISSIIARGQTEVFKVLLEKWRGMGGLEGGRG